MTIYELAPSRRALLSSLGVGSCGCRRYACAQSLIFLDLVVRWGLGAVGLWEGRAELAGAEC
jgi:hypothetical protein